MRHFILLLLLAVGTLVLIREAGFNTKSEVLVTQNDNRLIDYTQYRTNKKGYVVREYLYTKEGTADGYYIYKYNKNGQLTSKRHLEGNISPYAAMIQGSYFNECWYYEYNDDNKIHLIYNFGLDIDVDVLWGWIYLGETYAFNKNDDQSDGFYWVSCDAIGRMVSITCKEGDFLKSVSEFDYQDKRSGEDFTYLSYLSGTKYDYLGRVENQSEYSVEQPVREYKKLQRLDTKGRVLTSKRFYADSRESLEYEEYRYVDFVDSGTPETAGRKVLSLEMLEWMVQKMLIPNEISYDKTFSLKLYERKLQELSLQRYDAAGMRQESLYYNGQSHDTGVNECYQYDEKGFLQAKYRYALAECPVWQQEMADGETVMVTFYTDSKIRQITIKDALDRCIVQFDFDEEEFLDRRTETVYDDDGTILAQDVWAEEDAVYGLPAPEESDTETPGMEEPHMNMIVYEVQPGDTLWGIAQSYLGGGQYWGTIYNTNKDIIGTDPDYILPGMQLSIRRN